MKKVLLLVALCTAVACSASKKKDEAATTTTPATPAVAKEGTAAKADANTANKTAAGTQCKSGSDTRNIEVKAEGGGCEVMYTKMGETNSVASSVNGTDHCNTVAERIKTNLTNAGFTCE